MTPVVFLPRNTIPEWPWIKAKVVGASACGRVLDACRCRRAESHIIAQGCRCASMLQRTRTPLSLGSICCGYFGDRRGAAMQGGIGHTMNSFTGSLAFPNSSHAAYETLRLSCATGSIAHEGDGGLWCFPQSCRAGLFPLLRTGRLLSFARSLLHHEYFTNEVGNVRRTEPFHNPRSVPTVRGLICSLIAICLLENPLATNCITSVVGATVRPYVRGAPPSGLL